MPHHRIIKNGGFTLTEIIATLTIVSVLTALALPRLGGTIERVRAAEGVQILTALLGAQKAYEMETGSYTAVLADLDVEINSADNFDLPPPVFIPGAPGAPIASITRTGGYTLSINDVGTITCVDGAILCATAGY